ncbi:MAG: MBL fold metallo-hydrolase, partial [Candidatus Magasanikbacteria bacterium]|nr:MBL fold metallo-hydrolase [Candidatus Magasanikbacteria bacterium]
RFLFTGDMEMPLEDAILEKYCSDNIFPCPSLAADYLKVGHHGSESSSGVKFLKAVSARYSIVSVGAKNRYGHPSMRVLKKLERAKMEIWRTDLKGDIILE